MVLWCQRLRLDPAPEPVAIAGEVEGLGVVDDPVDQGRGGRAGAEDLGPASWKWPMFLSWTSTRDLGSKTLLPGGSLFPFLRCLLGDT